MWVKGQTGNAQGRGSKGAKVVERIRFSADKMIDKVGVTEFSDILADQFKQRPLETLKALAPWMPKDVNITTSKTLANRLTDTELQDIIATRAQEHRQAIDKQDIIEGEAKDITTTG